MCPMLMSEAVTAPTFSVLTGKHFNVLMCTFYNCIYVYVFKNTTEKEKWI